MGSHLFSPISLSTRTLANRIVVAPMCQYSAHDGCPSPWHATHLGTLAIGGAALLLLEATAVAPHGRISPGDLGLWNAAQADALRRLVADIRTFSNTPMGIQLGHAGRKASTAAPWHGGKRLSVEQGGWQPVAPSAVAYTQDEPAPASLDATGIAAVVAAFGDAARRAGEAGLDVVELHAAHGYLLHQFLSPLTNQRTDGYGGPLAHRTRLTLEVFDAVRAAFPKDRPVGVRVSATDWADGGWDLEQTVALASALAARGAAYLHVSSGGLVPQQAIPVGPSYQVPLARELKARTPLPIIAVGMITEPTQAEAIVSTGDADLVALARAFLYDPRWGWHAAAELGASVDAPVQVRRSQPRQYPNLFSR